MKTENIIKLLIVLLLITSVTLAFIAPKFEAESFNKCTGGNATYKTAFFTELRVDNCQIK